MRADLYTAPALFVLGAAMSYGGYTMDRLEIRQIHPASIPGLVPMLLGAALMLAAIVLFLQARSALASGPQPETDTGSTRDLVLTALSCGVYALLLVGNIPFPAATAIFVASFILIFEADPSRGKAHLARIAAIAIVLGVAVAAATSILFRYAFLVRLP